MADTFLTFLRYRSKELLVFQETPSKCKLPTPTPSIPKSSPSLPAWSCRRRKVTWPKKARQPHAFDVFLTLKKIKDSFQVENMTTGFPTSQAIFRAYACNFRFLGFFLKRKCQKSNYKNSWLFGKARSSWEQAVSFPLSKRPIPANWRPTEKTNTEVLRRPNPKPTPAAQDTETQINRTFLTFPSVLWAKKFPSLLKEFIYSLTLHVVHALFPLPPQAKLCKRIPGRRACLQQSQAKLTSFLSTKPSQRYPFLPHY